MASASISSTRGVRFVCEITFKKVSLDVKSGHGDGKLMVTMNTNQHSSSGGASGYSTPAVVRSGRTTFWQKDNCVAFDTILQMKTSGHQIEAQTNRILLVGLPSNQTLGTFELDIASGLVATALEKKPTYQVGHVLLAASAPDGMVGTPTLSVSVAMECKGFDDGQNFTLLPPPPPPLPLRMSASQNDNQELAAELSAAKEKIRSLEAMALEAESSKTALGQELDNQKEASSKEILALKGDIERNERDLKLLRNAAADERIAKAELIDMKLHLEDELTQSKKELASARGKLSAADKAIKDAERTRKVSILGINEGIKVRAEMDTKERMWEKVRKELIDDLDETREQAQTASARVKMLQFELEEAQKTSMADVVSPLRSSSPQNDSIGELMTFIEQDLHETVLRDLSYDETSEHKFADPDQSLSSLRLLSPSRKFSSNDIDEDLRQAQSRNEAISEVAKLRAAQLSKKEQQCVNLAGELASWNSKFRRIEDRLQVKERETRVAEKRAKEARQEVQKAAAQVQVSKEKASADAETIASLESTIEDLQTKLHKVTLLMAENGIDTFDLNNSTPSGQTGAISAGATAVSSHPAEPASEEKPRNFFTRMLRS